MTESRTLTVQIEEDDTAFSIIEPQEFNINIPLSPVTSSISNDDHSIISSSHSCISNSISNTSFTSTTSSKSNNFKIENDNSGLTLLENKECITIKLKLHEEYFQNKQINWEAEFYKKEIGTLINKSFLKDILKSPAFYVFQKSFVELLKNVFDACSNNSENEYIECQFSFFKKNDGVVTIKVEDSGCGFPSYFLQDRNENALSKKNYMELIQYNNKVKSDKKHDNKIMGGQHMGLAQATLYLTLLDPEKGNIWISNNVNFEGEKIGACVCFNSCAWPKHIKEKNQLLTWKINENIKNHFTESEQYSIVYEYTLFRQNPLKDEQVYTPSYDYKFFSHRDEKKNHTSLLNNRQTNCPTHSYT